MSGLTVELREPQVEDLFIPRYDDDADLLVVDSRVSGPWIYGINIDGLVIFDIVEDRRLASIELIWPRRYWEKQALTSVIGVGQPAALAFTPDAVAAKDFDLQVRASIDPATSVISIIIGRERTDSQPIVLSPYCSALIAANELVGFQMRIA